MERARGRAIFGTAAAVAGKLHELGRSLGVDELAVLTTTHDPDARRRSYALLAAAWGMAAQPVALAAE